MSSLFKTKGMIGDSERLFNDLKQKFGEKYKVEFHKASTGAMKFMTGNTSDYVTIKKSAYHGASIAISPEDTRIDYQTITYGSITPNAIVNQIMGKSGLLDRLIAQLIWGSGKEFYNSIEEFIQTEYNATEVDMGVMNTIKQTLKGKTVMDD